MAEERLVSIDKIKQHSSKEDCWIVVNGIIWDITAFAPEHPGGGQIIWKYAGRDASKEYNAIHASSVLPDNLDSSKRIGRLDTSSIPSNSEWLKPPPETQPQLEVGERPALQTLINSYDFEEVAKKTLSKKAWAFYSSAATDLITRDANISMFNRIWLRPRILRNVKEINTKTTMLGHELSFPLFIAPAAMAKLAHPEGEIAMARAASTQGIAQIISTNASFPAPTIASSSPSTTLFFQLYINRSRPLTTSLLSQIHAAGLKAIFVTVDAHVQGKREADERVRADSSVANAPMSGARASNDSKGGGLGRTMGGFIDPTFSWADLAWLRANTHLPIVVKGIQTAADALLAARAGVDGIVVSNHGGRNLDGSPAAVLTLLEIRRLAPEVFRMVEVYLDGGVRRGQDVFKALCLGATAVGMGRPFLYAVNYGEEGVRQLIEIMRDEFETTMRLAGVTDLDQLHPGLVNTGDVDHLIPKELDALDMVPRRVDRRRAKL